MMWLLEIVILGLPIFLGSLFFTKYCEKAEQKKDRNGSNVNYVIEYPVFFKGLSICCFVVFGFFTSIFIKQYISGRSSIDVIIGFLIITFICFLMLVHIHKKIEVLGNKVRFRRWLKVYDLDFNDIEVRTGNFGFITIYKDGKKLVSISGFMRNWNKLYTEVWKQNKGKKKV